MFEKVVKLNVSFLAKDADCHEFVCENMCLCRYFRVWYEMAMYIVLRCYIRRRRF